MFAKLAAERVARVLARIAEGDLAAVAAELHALSGEAALLQLRGIAELAREGEGIARKGDAVAECERVVRALGAQIDALSG
jgi:hypothetical protein